MFRCLLKLLQGWTLDSFAQAFNMAWCARLFRSFRAKLLWVNWRLEKTAWWISNKPGFFLPIKWIKMDSNGPWHGILQEFLGISWWWAPMEPRKQHLESGLKKPRWIGGAHIISGETHWDSTLWWWYIHMIIYIYVYINTYMIIYGYNVFHRPHPVFSSILYSICARFRDVVHVSEMLCTCQRCCARFPAVVHVSQKLCTCTFHRSCARFTSPLITFVFNCIHTERILISKSIGATKLPQSYGTVISLVTWPILTRIRKPDRRPAEVRLGADLENVAQLIQIEKIGQI